MALTPSQQFASAITETSRVLVVLPKGATIDQIVSALAVREFLVRRGKNVDVVCDGFVVPQQLRFLKEVSSIESAVRALQTFVISVNVATTKADEIAYNLVGDRLEIAITPKSGAYTASDVSTKTSQYAYGCVVLVGVMDLVSLGAVYSAHPDFFYTTPKVVIDCNPANERFGNINIVDVTTSSCAEIVYGLLRELEPSVLNEDVSTMIIAGMIAGTRRFTSPSLSPRTLEIASELTARGARRDEVMQALYRTRTLGTLKLWGRALARLKHDAVRRLAWTLLIRNDFVHAGADVDDLSGVLDELMSNTPDADTFMVIYERDVDKVEVLVSGVQPAMVMKKLAGLRGVRDEAGVGRVVFEGLRIVEVEKKMVETLG
jgi:nanoRNase/pAp phosphatase (c-di-AMP/oligoRNAs hydrolase)